MKVDNVAHDAATLSLHVICAAGFGAPQLGLERTRISCREVFCLDSTHSSLLKTTLYRSRMACVCC
jgi:hypothetical protein